MGFIAGQYHVKYGTVGTEVTVGQIQDGVTIEYFMNKQLITGDNLGSTPQDAVIQGWECFIEFTLMEYGVAGAAAAFWPYQTFGSMVQGTSTVVGQLDSTYAKGLTLSHTQIGSGPFLGLGTSAATAPTTLSVPSCVLAEGYPVRLLFAPALRTIPIRLRVYPSVAGVLFTTT